MNHTLQVIIELDKDGYFAFVPELKAATRKVTAWKR
jgi:predicted RNase H-like HicB family nuclease